MLDRLRLEGLRLDRHRLDRLALGVSALDRLALGEAGPLAAARLVATGAAALAVGASLGYLRLIRRPLPRTRGELHLPGLVRDVEVRRDTWGVPHVYAETLSDLFFGQGYVQAQDRLWQMELTRRAATGRLSEVVGRRGLPVDRFYRRLGLARAAAVEEAGIDDETREAITAYSGGVNAYIERYQRRLPVEFALLAYSPEPWQVRDTLAVGKLLGWVLSCNWETELLRSHLLADLGPDVAAALEPLYPAGHPITTTPGRPSATASGFALGDFVAAAKQLGVGRAAGSNAWAIDGTQTASGKPILANDPHLEAQLPSFWHEAHLEGAGFDVTGACVPGVIGVIAGHNRRIAWGVTMSMADDQDLFVERTNPANPRQVEYEGRWVDAQVLTEEIRVRGRRKPVVEEVLISRHGPAISPAIPGENQLLTLRGTALEPGQPGAVLALDRATCWAEFQTALGRWNFASLSFAYADVDGNIGYQMSGRIPIRRGFDGLVPAPGWTGEHEWLGYVPTEEMPSVFRPASHHVVTANNRIVPDGYPYAISQEWVDGYRAKRITELLNASRRHDVASSQAIQLDIYSLPAAELRDYLTEIGFAAAWRAAWSASGSAAERTPTASEQARAEIGSRALELFFAWDCQLEVESSEAALYEVWRFELLRAVFGGKVGRQLDHYLGLGHESLIHTNVNRVRVTAHLLRLLRERPADWFSCTTAGTGAASSWAEAPLVSFAAALNYLIARLGPEPTAWRWGDLHQVTFRHPLGLGPLNRLLDRGPYPLAGNAETVAASGVDFADPFDALGATVSYRQVIDLADFDRSVSVLPCGQSGQPGNAHYADQLALWRTGRQHPMLFSRAAVERGTVDRLVLRPATDRPARPDRPTSGGLAAGMPY